MNTLLDKFGHTAQLFLTISVTTAFLGAIYLLMLAPIDLPSGARELLSLLIGVLVGSFKDINGYWFGSSLGSARKEQSTTTRAP